MLWPRKAAPAVHEQGQLISEGHISEKDPALGNILLGGRLCLQLQRSTSESTPTHMLDLVGAYVDVEDVDARLADTATDVWLHVGLLYLKPYRPTFQVVECLTGSKEGRAEVSQTGEFLTLTSLAESVSLTESWCVMCWQILDTEEPLPKLMPSTAHLQKLDVDTFTLWPIPAGSKKRRRQTRPRRAPQSGTPAVDASTSSALPDYAPPVDPAESDSSDEDPSAADDESVPDSTGNESLEIEELLFQAFNPAPPATADDATGQPDSVLEEVPASIEKAEKDVANDPLLQTLAEALQVVQEQTGEPQDQEPADRRESAGVGEEREQQPATPPVSEAGVSARKHERAECSAEVPGGRITYYRQGFFSAQCTAGHHGRCVLTRSAQPGRKRAQGRPLGLMMYWLSRGEGFATRADHWNKDHWPTHEERSACRRQLAQLPGGQDLLDQERPQEAGEASEPDQAP